MSFTCISSQNAVSNILNLANIYIFTKCNNIAQNEQKKSPVGERMGHCSMIGEWGVACSNNAYVDKWQKQKLTLLQTDDAENESSKPANETSSGY